MGDRAKEGWPKTLTIIDLGRDEDFAKYESQMQNKLEGGDKGALLRFVCALASVPAGRCRNGRRWSSRTPSPGLAVCRQPRGMRFLGSR